MNKKSLISSGLIGGLLLVVLLSTMPVGVTAQMAYYYNGYNASPRWSTPGNQTVVQGQTLSVSVFAVDDNGDPLSYSTLQAPAGSAYNSLTHVFSFTPSYSQLGSFPVTLGATDGKSAVAYVTFYVNVTIDYGHYVYGGGAPSGHYNQAPYFSATVSNYQVNSGNNLRFTVNAVDPEGQELRYSVSGLPAGASFDAVSHAFSWTPASNQRGSYALSFSASDGYAASVPLSVTIVVDGGILGYNQLYPNSNIGSATQYYPNQAYYPSQGISTCSALIPPTYATAGQVYTYLARSCSVYDYPTTYQLTVAPVGAAINPQTGLLTWAVPKNAVNKDYQFVISASNGYTAVPDTQSFTVTVQGGTAEVTTVVTQPKTVVQYVNTPAVPTQNSAANYYYPNTQQNIYVSTGRTVTPVNYQYYQAGAYGTVLPAPAVAISTFNISVRVSADKEMIISWDTNKPTTGEVVFGYASQSRGSDLNRTILNYDFTTGQISETATRHEASLGRLDTDQTYYLRVISRADNQTDISREIVFIPMATQEGGIVIKQSEGAASAADSLGSFLVSGGFLFFLLLVIIGLIIYLIVLSRRPLVASGGTYPHAPEHIVFHPEEHR